MENTKENGTIVLPNCVRICVKTNLSVHKLSIIIINVDMGLRKRKSIAIGRDRCLPIGI